MGWRRFHGFAILQELVGWNRSSWLSRSRSITAVVVASNRSDLFERPVCILGTPPSASRGISLALSLDSSQCRTPRLARRPSRASIGYGVHRGANQFASIRTWISTGDAGGAAGLSWLVGH